MSRARDGRGFSMVEVLVAAVVFVTAAAGIFATVAQTQVGVKVSDARSRATLCGKEVLDGLSKEVADSTWDTGAMAIGGPYAVAGSYPNCIAGYTPTYSVAAVADGTRQVTVTVSW